MRVRHGDPDSAVEAHVRSAAAPGHLPPRRRGPGSVVWAIRHAVAAAAAADAEAAAGPAGQWHVR